MSEFATKKDVQEIVDKAVEKVVDDLSGVITQLAQTMQEELTVIKQEQANIRASIDRLTNTINGFVARIDNYEVEQTAR